MTDVEGGGREPHPWVAGGANRIRFGVVPVPGEWSAERDWAQMLEDLNFDSHWVFDHPARAHDAWTRLSALAVLTRGIRLGTCVSCIYYRSPAALARMAADVDRFSDGRLVLGLGTGWDRSEFTQMGIPFPPFAERSQALEETIAILRGLWSGEPFSYSGAQFRVADLELAAPPVQQPYVPLLIAGGGSTTLRQVARQADMANFGPTNATGGAFGLDTTRRKYAALDDYCAEFGRAAGSVIHSYYTVPVLASSEERARAIASDYPESVRQQIGDAMVVGTPEQAIPIYQELIDAGVNYFIAAWQRDITSVRLLAEQVMPYLRVPSN